MITANERRFLKLKWIELFGATGSVFTEDQRLQRWELWKDIAMRNGDADLVAYWTDGGDCGDCRYLDAAKQWCGSCGLPCTVNPIITFSEGLVGMACRGIGYEPPEGKQLAMFEIENYEPL